MRLAGEPGNGDFGQRGNRLSDYIEILRRITLPFFRRSFLRKLDDLVAREVSPTRGVIPHDRCLDVNDRIRLGFNRPFFAAQNGARVNNRSNDVRICRASANVTGECGFHIIATDRGFAQARSAEIEEQVLRLEP